MNTTKLDPPENPALIPLIDHLHRHGISTTAFFVALDLWLQLPEGEREIELERRKEHV